MNNDTEDRLEPILSYLRLVAKAGGHQGIYLLENGRDWQPGETQVRQGLPKACFHNAQKAAIQSGGRFLYAEGYALSGNLKVLIPIHHGWLIDEDGKACDPTWEQSSDSVYFGVAFRPEYVREQAKKEGYYDSLLEFRALMRGFDHLDGALADMHRDTMLTSRP